MTETGQIYLVRTSVGIPKCQKIIQEKIKCVLTHCREFPKKNSKRPPEKKGKKVE